MRILLWTGGVRGGGAARTRCCRGHDAAVVGPPAGSEAGSGEGAAARADPVHQFRSLKVPEARQAFEAADADLGLLAYVTQIVPEPLLHIPRRSSLCFHPSLLPRYRGGSAINWQLIRGETEGGVTVFWPDAGIDTGPILLQRLTPEDLDASTQELSRSECRRLDAGIARSGIHQSPGQSRRPTILSAATRTRHDWSAPATRERHDPRL